MGGDGTKEGETKRFEAKILQKVMSEKRLEESKGDPGTAFGGLNGSKK